MRRGSSSRSRSLRWQVAARRAVDAGRAPPDEASFPPPVLEPVSVAPPSDLLHRTPRPWDDLVRAVQLVRFAFEGGECSSEIEALVEALPVSPSDFLADASSAQLHLDGVVRACMPITIDGATARPHARLLRRVLASPPRDPEDCTARQSVLRELVDRPTLRTDLERLYGAVCRLRQALTAGAADEPNLVRRKIAVLGALQAAVDALAGGFEGSATVLARLRAQGEAVRARPEWQRLVQLLDLEGNIATVDLRLRLGSDGTIRGFGVLAIHENPDNDLLPGPVRRLFQRIGSFLRGYRYGEREVVVRMLDLVFAPLAGDAVGLLALTGALELYLAALGFRDLARAKGLSVCLPEIVETPDLHARTPVLRHLAGLFDPLLFLQGVTPVPCAPPTGPHDALVVVTGPNSGGKTRLLEALALTQLLGQVGLFVPAAEARLVRAPRLFVSLAMESDPAQVEGRLGTELLRIRQLFEQLEPGSLAILDELCSGTNPGEGESIFEMVVSLLPRLRPQVFVSTHFLSLAARLERERPVAGLAFLQVELDADERPTWQFVPGVAATSLAHKVAARLGVTRDELRALVDAKAGD